MLKSFVPAFGSLFILIIGLPVLFQTAGRFDRQIEIEDGIALTNLTWAADSSKFVYYDATKQPYQPDTHKDYDGVEVTDAAWQEFNLTTQTLTASTVWPLQPGLTKTEQAVFNPYPDNFIYASPNNRLLVYAKALPTDSDLRAGIPFAIGYRPTLDFVTFNAITDVPDAPDATPVMWSEDGTRFAIGYVDSPSATPVVIYFELTTTTDLQNSIISQALDTSTRNKEVTYRGQSYAPYVPFEDRLLDISDSGDKLLLKGRLKSGDMNSEPQRLMIWSPQFPQTNYVFEQWDAETIEAASFLSDSDTCVLIVNEQGLIVYNLITQQPALIRSDLSSTTMIGAFFSPNAKWLAVQRNTTLSFLDLNQISVPLCSAGS